MNSYLLGYKKFNINRLIFSIFSLVLGFALILCVLEMAGFSTLYAKTTRKTGGNIRRKVRKPDLDVTYISRAPRYHRYKVDYPKTPSGVGIPVLAKGTEHQKRWPSVGEKVTYTAHIMNRGNVSSPRASFQWLIDGKVAKRGMIRGLRPGQEVTVRYSNRWQKKGQKIEFKVDPGKAISEICKKNNSLRIGSRDIALSIWAEKGIYDIFNRTKNLVGSYSFEDWIQAQVAMMNRRFAQAKYPVAPNGILDRVRIDKIVVAEDLDGPNSPMNKDPHLLLIDGRWQFKDNSTGNIQGRKGAWQKYVNMYVMKIDWGLIHELAHQLGIIDLYRMNLINNKKKYPNNGIWVRDRRGSKIPVTKLPTASWNQVLFKNPGIMAGGSTLPYKKSNYFSSHTAAGMNTNYGHRRGFYGDYLFDTPAKNYLKILDKSGKPLIGAMVELFQKDPNTEVIDNIPEIAGRTNSRGIMFLPNRPVKSVTTITGHTLRPNPFGQIHVVGPNGTMLIRITKNKKEDFAWLFIVDLNMAYWSGKKGSAIYTIRTKLSQ